MKHKDLFLLDYLIEQVDVLQNYTGNKTEDEFYRDNILKDACYARIMVLGEYAGKLSEDFRTKYDNVDWNVI